MCVYILVVRVSWLLGFVSAAERAERLLLQWTAANEGGAMSPEDVLGVIKRNYGSLKLTLLDNLDVYTPYMEQVSGLCVLVNAC